MSIHLIIYHIYLLVNDIHLRCHPFIIDVFTLCRLAQSAVYYLWKFIQPGLMAYIKNSIIATYSIIPY